MNAAWKRGAGLAGMAALMALLLAGCGGGDGVSPATHEQALQELEAAQAELRAQEEAAAEEAAERAAAEAAAKAAAEAAAAQEEAEQEQDEVDALTALVAQLTTALAAEEEEEDETTPETETPAATTHAGLFPAGDEEEEDETTATTPTATTPTTPTPTTPTEPTEAEKAVVAARAAVLVPELEIETADMAGATIEWMRGDTLTFEPATISTRSGTAPSVPGGWRSGSFSRARGADGTETAYLYTNIQSAGTRAFWKVYGDDVVSTDTNAITNSGVWDATLARRTGALQFVDTDADNTDDQGRFLGTYAGVGGTFTCAGADTTACNADNAASPATGLTITQGTWTFMPTRGGLTSGVRLSQDTEYLYFGIWAYDPDDITATPGFRWIGGGMSSLDATLYGALTGTAKFTGGAVGKYALRNQPGQENDRIGTFAAKAEFTANFVNNTIYGDITDFREGGASLGANWSVYLGATSSTAAVLAAAGATTPLVATASIGGVSATGAWAATLYGSNNPGYVDFDDPGSGATDCPLSGGCLPADLAGVTGWFEALSTSTTPNAAGTAVANAAIAGAFGAACTTGPCAR